MASGDADAALHKFEVAIDLVTDVQRTDRASQKLIEEKNTQKSCRGTREQATNDGKSHSRRMNDDGMRITPAQVKDIVKKFKTFDRNSDKSLDLEEMTTVFRALGQNPTKAQIKAMMKEADKDGNGKMDEMEYIDLLMRHMQTEEEVESEMREAFKAFDKNNDGKVDTKELVTILQMCGEPLTTEESRQLMRLMDENGDGVIDINEFVSFLCKGKKGKTSEVIKKPAVKRR